MKCSARTLLWSCPSFRRRVLSLHLNDATANTLMKKLQLLFTFLSHTQVCLPLLSVAIGFFNGNDYGSIPDVSLGVCIR